MNNSNPKISIVVLNYNGLRFLEKAIPAFLNLTYKNLEFVFVDNNSQDKSIEFIENSFNRSNHELKLIKNTENLGYTKGKNIGVGNATGEFVLMLDNDIVLQDANIIEELLNNYSSEICFLYVPEIDVDQVKTNRYGLFPSIYGINHHKKYLTFEEINSSSQDLVEILSPSGAFMFFQKSKWDEIGGFDELQAFNLDDVDIGPRAYLFGYKSYLFTKTYAIHLGVDNSKEKSSTSISYANRMTTLFSGHARAMFKNYKLTNLIIRFPIFFAYMFFKATSQSIKKQNINIFINYIKSIIFFMKNMRSTLQLRSGIQSKRKIKGDLFLNIKVFNPINNER